LRRKGTGRLKISQEGVDRIQEAFYQRRQKSKKGTNVEDFTIL
jgi:hypothetical protein